MTVSWAATPSAWHAVEGMGALTAGGAAAPSGPLAAAGAGKVSDPATSAEASRTPGTTGNFTTHVPWVRQKPSPVRRMRA